MNPDPSARRPIRPIDPSQLRPQRKVFDIARPGRTPASSTSRPIAVSHQPPVHDTSVTMHGQNRMFGQRAPASQPTEAPTEFMPAPQPVSRPVAPVSRVGHTLTPPQPQMAAPQPPRPRPQPLQPTPNPQPPRPLTSPPAAPVVATSAQPARVQPLRAPATAASVYPQPHVTGGRPTDDIPSDIGPMHINEDPVLISKHVPKDENNKWRWIIIASVIFFFFLVIFDILLDADFITMRQVPHTHFF